MKKTIAILAVLVVVAVWVVCFPAKFADGSGDWLFSGGLWIIPVALQLAALWSIYRAYRAHKSGSWIIDEMGRITDRDGGIIPLTKIAQFNLFLGFQLGAIGVLIWQYLER